MNLRNMLVGLLFLSLAWAQEQDALLQSYGLAMDSLNLAVSSMATDSIQSSDELKRASDALRVLAAESSSTALIAALENTFTRAQTTIQNQSQADLAVQVAVLKGGFQRLIYEAAVNAANQGNTALTQQRLLRLASDLNLPSESQTALGSADLGQLFTSFERGIAQIARTRIDSVASILATDKALAYQTLAEAYSAFLPIQDSPRADASSTPLFTQAFSALVNDDLETLNASLSQLSQQMTQLENASAGLAQVGTTDPQTATVEATPNEAAPLEAAPVEATPTETTPVENTITETPSVETASVETTPVENTIVESTPVETTPVETTSETPAETEPIQTAQTPNNISSDILKSLSSYGLSSNQQSSLAERMSQQGFLSPSLVLDNLLANSARATMELQAGQAQKARDIFSTIQDNYSSLLEPIISNVNPDTHNTTASLLNNLSKAPSLRVQDAVTVSQQLGEVSKVLENTPPSGFQGLMSKLTNFWTGWTRPIVMIILGLFAFVPLYLLFLAFGGGNRNWQLVGYALFLLLVPVIYEGISFLLSSIATPLNMPALDVLSRFSIFQNSFTQLLWVILTATAIALATAGLYGICVQFGLLGKRNEDLATTMLETPVADTGMTAAKTTSFEWDEEF
jgi:hypothetical protein